MKKQFNLRELILLYSHIVLFNWTTSIGEWNDNLLQRCLVVARKYIFLNFTRDVLITLKNNIYKKKLRVLIFSP